MKAASWKNGAVFLFSLKEVIIMLPSHVNIRFLHKGKDNKNIYEIRIYMGKINGKIIRKTKNIHSTSQRAAIKLAEKMYHEGLLGPMPSEKPQLHSTTFAQLVQIWKERHASHLATRTQVNYQDILDLYLMDMFGTRKLDSIDVGDIRYFLHYLSNVPNSRTRTGFLSLTMISKCYKLLAHLLNKAVEWKLIPKNPCNELDAKEIPHPDYRPTPIWKKEELAQFIRHLEELSPTYPNVQKTTMFYLIFLTGLRRGEVSVLQWSDISFEDKTVSITKGMKDATSTRIEIGAPKTKKSIRVIPFDDFIYTKLSHLQKMQQDYLKDIGQANSQGYVFITQRRQSREIIPATPSYLYIWLRNEAKKCGLPLIGVHSIRHMAATYALASGAPILGVQNMMGHTSLRTTSIYLHIMDEQKKQTANALSNELASLRSKSDDSK